MKHSEGKYMSEVWERTGVYPSLRIALRQSIEGVLSLGREFFVKYIPSSVPALTSEPLLR